MTQEELKSLVVYDQETGRFTKFNNASAYKSGYEYKSICARGYARIRLKGKFYSAHRLAWLYVYGDMPERIDHIDGNKLNNAISNLRKCNARQNALNTGVSKVNSCGVKGITRVYKGNYVARVTVNYKQIHIGTFSTIEEAKAARNSYLKTLPDYEFNRS